MRTKLPTGGAAAIQVLCRYGQLTRRELQGLLEVSGPTVTRMVSHLDELGLITTTVVGDGSLGRPAEVIRLSDEGLAVISVSLTASGTKAALMSITGEVADEVEVVANAQVPYENAFENLLQAVRGLIDSARGRFHALAGIGISFGGSASFGEGRIIVPTGFPTWHGRALAKELENASGVPTFLDNQPVAYLRAMHWYLEQAPNNQFICFADYGLAGCASSAGMPTPDRGVFTGGFGHVGGRLSGEVACWCGLFDCLNTRASLRSLRAWAVDRGLAAAAADGPEVIRAVERDAVGRQKLQDAARELVTAAIDACRVLGADGYILGGVLFEASAMMRETAQEVIDQNHRLISGDFLPAEIARNGPYLSGAATAADGMTLSNSMEVLRQRAM